MVQLTLRMRILILGGSGRTGRLLVEEALTRGHQVNALVRDMTKFKAGINTFQKPGIVKNLNIFEGTPAEPKSIETAIGSCEAVLSVLNISRHSDFPWSSLRTPADFLSSTLTTIIDQCYKNKIQRIILTTAWGVNETRQHIPGWFRWIIDHSNVGTAYRDHERQEILLRASALDYTAVRPVGLTNSNNKKQVIVSLDNKPEPRLMISRRNLARFMMDTLEKNQYIRQEPVVFE